MRLDLLILARIAGGKAPTPRDLSRQLRRLADPGASEAEFRRALALRFDELTAKGWMLHRPLRATEAGLAELRRALGTDEVPSWNALCVRHLPALALGLEPGRAIHDPRAAILAHLLGRESASVARLVDAVVAAELGIDGAVTLPKIRAHLLARRLGLAVRAGGLDDLVGRAVATAVKAPRADKKSLRVALLRRWLTADEPAAPAPSTPAAPDDAELAAAVRAVAAAAPPSARFGADKVFVSAIWRTLDGRGPFARWTLDQFKAWLVTANQGQLLTLARADLVGAMDPREVAASEIRFLNATFHFVLDRARR